MFGRKRKKKEEVEPEPEGESIADVLNSRTGKIERELAALEEKRKNGEMSDEAYFETRKRLESLKRQMENMG